MAPPTDSTFRVGGNIYGGGENGSLGDFTRNSNSFPTACAENTGNPLVIISGGTVGPTAMPATFLSAYAGTDFESDRFVGMVFGGCKGSVGDTTTATYGHLPMTAFCNNTDVRISNEAFIKGSVYGGGANGHVLHNTHVTISGGQIGCGEGQSAPYRDDQFVDPTTTTVTTDNDLDECPHWNYGDGSIPKQYNPYDPVEQPTAYDGHTFYGNVFGGGSGVFPFTSHKVGSAVDANDSSIYIETSGRVYGSTLVEITGGHILTSVYGGCESGDVTGDSCIVTFGGTATIGVPRTEAEIIEHPVIGSLFGAGKGDERVRFNKRTNVQNTRVTVNGGIIYGSVFGGGEDGHVMRNSKVEIKSGAKIGTFGTTYFEGNVFGGGRGFSGNALTAGNVAGDVTLNITGGTMLGSVFGGGRLASVGYGLYLSTESGYGVMQPDVPDNTETPEDESFSRGHIYVNISGGTIGNDIASDYTSAHPKSGNVFGASMGRLVKLDGSYLGDLWLKLGSAKQSVVNITAGTIKGNVYGGSEIGSVTGNTQVNISGGTLGREVSSTRYHGNVYGGGYGYKTPDENNPDINRNSLRDSVEHLAGRTYGNTEVNITAGTISGNVYGGGEMASIGKEEDATMGNTVVNIGSGTVEGGFATSVSGSANILGGNVFGANNINGSPLGNTTVNIYSTNRSAKQLASCTDDDREYALADVFGGGNQADYEPISSTARASVHVYSCANTIRRVFGGGDAAAAYGVAVTIDGGRIYQVFGGGNGEVTEANIGAGGTNTVINGGVIHQIFGGSNEQGSIAGPVITDLTHESSCDEEIDEFFSGSNEAPIIGDVVTTIECGAGSFGSVYGGCNEARIIYGNVTFNIYGGTFTNVFGGSKGTTTTAANIDAYPLDFGGEHATDEQIALRGTGGTVTLNLYGGTIENAFGGSDINGNIEGKITVNVNDAEDGSCPLVITNIYGGSNLAEYTPLDPTIVSPEVNVNHIASKTVSGKTVDGILGNVYGGGKGKESTFTNGVCQRDADTCGRCNSNPQVNIGDNNADHWAKVIGTTVRNAANTADSLPPTSGNVYGGGEMAEVNGSTVINIINTNTEATHTVIAGHVFGGGKGYVGDSIAANVDGNTTINMTGGKVEGNIYGGGELASVGSFITLDNGNHDIKVNTGLATVNITGGHVGKDDNDHATATNANGNVYGAGLGDIGTATHEGGTFHYVYYNYVNNTHVTIDGASTKVRGSVFGGAEDGHVWRNTQVYIKDGEIGTELTTAEENEQLDGEAAIIYTGNVYGGGRGIDELEAVNHTHSVTAGRVFGNTYVEVSGGVINHSVFGGGSLASVGDTIHEVTAGKAYDIMGNVITGDYTFDTTLDGSANITRTYQLGDPVTGTGLAHVRICGGRIGRYGHNEGFVFGSGRGLPGDASHTDLYHMAYVHNTKVFIKDTILNEVKRHADVRGSVFGGGANGHVTQNTYVTMSAGVVGGKTSTDYSAAELAAHPLPGSADTTINGIAYYSGVLADDTLKTDQWGRITSGRTSYLGNVYAGGRGIDRTNNGLGNLSRFAGRVFGNARVDISGGVVYHNVYGGGSVASVGNYIREVLGSDTITGREGLGNGHAVVNISGGRIGTNGRNNGLVFGSSRGRTGGEYVHDSYTNTTAVTISGDALVRGCVFGGGEDGHVLDSTMVTIAGGTIGNGFRKDARWINTFIGNVYGGGRGVDLNANNKPSNTAGRVYGSTHVRVTGGHIHHNVYGGGSMASVGTLVSPVYSDYTGKTGRAWVDIEGGLIGIVNNPLDSSANLYGHVFGGGRGRAGIGLVNGNNWDEFTYVTNTVVRVRYAETAITKAQIFAPALDAKGYPHITGNVFGGGNNGHVNNSTKVTITRGLIGSAGDQGFGSAEGCVFGGGCGEDKYECYVVKNGYYLTNANVANGSGNSGVAYNSSAPTDRSGIKTYYETARTHNDSIAVTYELSTMAGLTYGNATVTINGATADSVLIRHHVYGGGANASVGDYWVSTGTSDSASASTGLCKGEVFPLTSSRYGNHPGTVHHAGSNTATGVCTVNIVGGTIGTSGGNNGMVFGSSRGDIGPLGTIYDSIAYTNNNIISS